MTRPLNVAQLDASARAGCQNPGCTHQHEQTVYLHGRCHPKGKALVSYTLGTGELVVTCVVCRRLIAVVAVAL